MHRKGTPKNLCDKDFAELSGGLSGMIYWDRALELFRTFFGIVLAILWLWGSFLALDFFDLHLEFFCLPSVPKAITLQHVLFGQLISGAVA